MLLSLFVNMTSTLVLLELFVHMTSTLVLLELFVHMTSTRDMKVLSDWCHMIQIRFFTAFGLEGPAKKKPDERDER